jgi:transketolase
MPTALNRCHRISIDGHTEISFTEDVSKRYEALGWHVQHVKDGNTDLSSLRSAIEAAKKDPRPSMIKVCDACSWNGIFFLGIYRTFI